MPYRNDPSRARVPGRVGALALYKDMLIYWHLAFIDIRDYMHINIYMMILTIGRQIGIVTIW